MSMRKTFVGSISLRYLFSQQQARFIAFMGLASIVGIALGVTILITVLSIMNGFDQQIQQRIFGMANHITIADFPALTHWKRLREQVLAKHNIQAVAPFVQGQAMLSHLGVIRSVMVFGIDPQLENTVSSLNQKMQQGQLTDLKTHAFAIVIGERLAKNLGLTLGDKVVIITPKTNISLMGFTPRFKRFTVVGIFKVGNGFGFDSQYAFINLKDAQQLYQLDQQVSGLRLKVSTLYAAPMIAKQLQQQLDPHYLIHDWSQQYGELFKAIRMEKSMMFCILLLIIAVAAFNLVSSLVMLVIEKRSDIAILRTLGATPATIMQIFMLLGGLIGFLGTTLGIIGGVSLACNATRLVAWIESTFHLQLFTSSAYYVSYLPSQLQWQDVFQVSLISILIALLATLYPAWRAANTKVSEALRHG